MEMAGRYQVMLLAGIVVAIVSLGTIPISAQESAFPGTAPPPFVRAIPVHEPFDAFFFTGLEILAAEGAGPGLVKVISTIGSQTLPETDARTTDLYIAYAVDIDGHMVFKVADLLSPEVVCIVGRAKGADVYLSYGLPPARRLIRVGLEEFRPNVAEVDLVTVEVDVDIRCPGD